MGFEGYKIKYKLTVLEHPENTADAVSLYAKTFDLTFFIATARTRFLRFDQIESVITDSLRFYSGKEIRQVYPFDEYKPTLEHMGSIFFQLLKLVHHENYLP